MTHIETARINEVIGIQIGRIQEEASKLKANSDIEVTEAVVTELEKAIADLKDTLAALPHQHR